MANADRTYNYILSSKFIAKTFFKISTHNNVIIYIIYTICQVNISHFVNVFQYKIYSSKNIISCICYFLSK